MLVWPKRLDGRYSGPRHGATAMSNAASTPELKRENRRLRAALAAARRRCADAVAQRVAVQRQYADIRDQVVQLLRQSEVLAVAEEALLAGSGGADLGYSDVRAATTESSLLPSAPPSLSAVCDESDGAGPIVYGGLYRPQAVATAGARCATDMPERTHALEHPRLRDALADVRQSLGELRCCACATRAFVHTELQRHSECLRAKAELTAAMTVAGLSAAHTGSAARPARAAHADLGAPLTCSDGDDPDNGFDAVSVGQCNGIAVLGAASNNNYSEQLLEALKIIESQHERQQELELAMARRVAEVARWRELALRRADDQERALQRIEEERQTLLDQLRHAASSSTVSADDVGAHAFQRILPDLVANIRRVDPVAGAHISAAVAAAPPHVQQIFSPPTTTMAPAPLATVAGAANAAPTAAPDACCDDTLAADVAADRSAAAVEEAVLLVCKCIFEVAHSDATSLRSGAAAAALHREWAWCFAHELLLGIEELIPPQQVRQPGRGGSEEAALATLSHWQSQLSAWLERAAADPAGSSMIAAGASASTAERDGDADEALFHLKELILSLPAVHGVLYHTSDDAYRANFLALQAELQALRASNEEARQRAAFFERQLAAMRDGPATAHRDAGRTSEAAVHGLASPYAQSRSPVGVGGAAAIEAYGDDRSEAGPYGQRDESHRTEDELREALDGALHELSAVKAELEQFQPHQQQFEAERGMQRAEQMELQDELRVARSELVCLNELIRQMHHALGAERAEQAELRSQLYESQQQQVLLAEELQRATDRLASRVCCLHGAGVNACYRQPGSDIGARTAEDCTAQRMDARPTDLRRATATLPVVHEDSAGSEPDGVEEAVHDRKSASADGSEVTRPTATVQIASRETSSSTVNTDDDDVSGSDQRVAERERQLLLQLARAQQTESELRDELDEAWADEMQLRRALHAAARHADASATPSVAAQTDAVEVERPVSLDRIQSELEVTRLAMGRQQREFQLAAERAEAAERQLADQRRLEQELRDELDEAWQTEMELRALLAQHTHHGAPEQADNAAVAALREQMRQLQLAEAQYRLQVKASEGERQCLMDRLVTAQTTVESMRRAEQAASQRWQQSLVELQQRELLSDQLQLRIRHLEAAQTVLLQQAHELQCRLAAAEAALAEHRDRLQRASERTDRHRRSRHSVGGTKHAHSGSATRSPAANLSAILPLARDDGPPATATSVPYSPSNTLSQHSFIHDADGPD